SLAYCSWRFSFHTESLRHLRLSNWMRNSVPIADTPRVITAPQLVSKSDIPLKFDPVGACCSTALHQLHIPLTKKRNMRLRSNGGIKVGAFWRLTGWPGQAQA